MRYVLAALTFAAVLYGNVSAQAEKRIFIIANNADGYGVDRCLASGRDLRQRRSRPPIASRANSRRPARSARSTATRSPARFPPTGRACRGGACDEFVAIECSR